MILTFLYHCIEKEKYSNKIDIINEQFSYFSKKYNIVVPGDKLSFLKKNICLTFDDGYFDFYHYIFPILKKFNIKALLAIPVKFILDDTKIAPETRLAVSYSQAMKKNIYLEKAPFCTWKEIEEMSNTGLVKIANHSYTHKNLLEDDADFEKEILLSKEILEKRLKKEIDTFVYPLGKFNSKVHNFTKNHYKYIIRIGSSFNLGWKNINNLIYRVISDNLKRKDEHLVYKKYLSYVWFYLLNTFRGR